MYVTYQEWPMMSTYWTFLHQVGLFCFFKNPNTCTGIWEGIQANIKWSDFNSWYCSSESFTLKWMKEGWMYTYNAVIRKYGVPIGDYSYISICPWGFVQALCRLLWAVVHPSYLVLDVTQILHLTTRKTTPQVQNSTPLSCFSIHFTNLQCSWHGCDKFDVLYNN